MKFTAHDLARRMDASVLKFDTQISLVDQLVADCKKYDFGCAFAMPCFSPYLAEQLKGTNTEFGTSLGFPSGQVATVTKMAEAEYFVGLGADQVDMVMNVGWFKSRMYKEVEEEIRAIRKITSNTSLKVIIEVSLLTDQEIKDACKLVLQCGADFVKSGTGFAQATTLHHVELMKEAVGDDLRIKVAGGVRGLKTMLQMMDLGAERCGIGLSSGIDILNEAAQYPDGVELSMLK